jgi:hypothetical protein
MKRRRRPRRLWVVESRERGCRRWQPLTDCVRSYHRSACAEMKRLRRHWPDEEFQVVPYGPESK